MCKKAMKALNEGDPTALHNEVLKNHYVALQKAKQSNNGVKDNYKQKAKLKTTLCKLAVKL